MAIVFKQFDASKIQQRAGKKNSVFYEKDGFFSGFCRLQ
jgi:hypothetical protein